LAVIRLQDRATRAVQEVMVTDGMLDLDNQTDYAIQAAAAAAQEQLAVVLKTMMHDVLAVTV
jgi:hypothetical protein